jgi:hypothetical protein
MYKYNSICASKTVHSTDYTKAEFDWLGKPLRTVNSQVALKDRLKELRQNNNH